MRKPVAGKKERRSIFLIHQRRIPVTMAIPPGRMGTEMAMAEVMETMEMAAVRKPLASRCRHPVPSAEPIVKPSPSAVPVVAEVTEEAPVRKKEKPAVPKPSLTPEPVLAPPSPSPTQQVLPKIVEEESVVLPTGSGTAGGCGRGTACAEAQMGSLYTGH